MNTEAAPTNNIHSKVSWFISSVLRLCCTATRINWERRGLSGTDPSYRDMNGIINATSPR